MEKPWLNSAIVKGLQPMGRAKIGHILNPEAQLHWMTKDQRKHLLEFMREASEITYAEQKEDEEFAEALLKAAKKEVCKAFDTPDKIEEEWTASEFIRLLNFALEGADRCSPYGGNDHNVELADALGVEVPERIRQEWELCGPLGKAQLVHEGVLMMDKLDAIIKHFNIEVPKSEDTEK